MYRCFYRKPNYIQCDYLSILSCPMLSEQPTSATMLGNIEVDAVGLTEASACFFHCPS